MNYQLSGKDENEEIREMLAPERRLRKQRAWLGEGRNGGRKELVTTGRRGAEGDVSREATEDM